MPTASELGAQLGWRLARLGSKIREDSLARTTPALVQVASRVVDVEARRRAEAMQASLNQWLAEHATESPIPPAISGLFSALLKAGGWVAQNALSTAIGFAVGSAMAATLEPEFNRLTQVAWRHAPTALLTPTTLADLVARGWLDEGSAAEEARSQGIEEERFSRLVRLAQQRLAAGDVLTLYRRGDIDQGEAEQRLRDLGYADAEVSRLLRLSIILHSPEEALEAELEGQLPHEEALHQYIRAGGDPDDYQWRFNTRGQAPTPSQLLDLLNRGIIPERGRGPEATSYEQGFVEGPWRNKWMDAFLALREYVVPPRSVRAIVASGAWTPARGIEELAKSGVPADTAQAILEEARANKLSKERDLVKSEVLAAYRDGLLTRAEATSHLETMGYDATEADLILAIEDHQWERTFRDAAVRRIHTLYVSRRITDTEAQAALAGLGMAGAASSKLLAIWDQEAELPTAQLTTSQVQQALRRGLLTEEEARRRLRGMGYDPEEVEILIGLAAPR